MRNYINRDQRGFVNTPGSNNRLTTLSSSYLLTTNLDIYFTEGAGYGELSPGSTGRFWVRPDLDEDPVMEVNSWTVMTDSAGHTFYRFTLAFTTQALIDLFDANNALDKPKPFLSFIAEVAWTEDGNEDCILPFTLRLYDRVIRPEVDLADLDGAGDLFWVNRDQLREGDHLTWVFQGSYLANPVDPGSVSLQTIEGVGQLAVCSKTASEVDVSALLANFPINTIFYFEQGDSPSKHVLLQITDAGVETTPEGETDTYYVFPVTVLAGTSVPQDGAKLSWRFYGGAILPDSGATAGTYKSANVTVNAAGVVTAIEAGDVGFVVELCGEATNLTTGTNKKRFPIAQPMTLTGLYLLNNDPANGSVAVDVKYDGVTVFDDGAKLTMPSGESESADEDVPTLAITELDFLGNVSVDVGTLPSTPGTGWKLVFKGKAR